MEYPNSANKGDIVKINNIENVTDCEDVCLICLSEIVQGKKIDCGHVYHASCLRSWI